MSRHALGFDVGLSGVRAAVVREDGKLVAGARRAHRRARLADGLAEHDPADWLDGLAEAGGEALGAAGVPISTVGVAALGPAPVLVDEHLRALGPAQLFGLDRRAEPQRLRMVAGLAPERAAATLDNALPKLAWWREHEPGTTERAAWALDATGFLVASLTGVPVMDAVTACDYQLPGLGPPVPVPAPVDPAAIAGELTEEGARSLGLVPGLPVTAGSYDSFVDLAAAGVRRPGDAGVVLGSTLIVCRVVEPSASAPPGLGLSGYPGEGLLAGGWTLSGGLVLDWFAGGFANGRSHQELAISAAAIEPGGLLALPYLTGERTPLWDPSARGALLGLGAETGPAEVYRALVDSLALVLRDHGERLAGSLGPCPSWRVTGGGTRNAVWLQASADALGAPLEVVADASEAMGPALLALRALGADPERPVAARAEPDPMRTARYSRLHRLFTEVQPHVARTMQGLRALDRPEGT